MTAGLGSVLLWLLAAGPDAGVGVVGLGVPPEESERYVQANVANLRIAPEETAEPLFHAGTSAPWRLRIQAVLGGQAQLKNPLGREDGEGWFTDGVDLEASEGKGHRRKIQVPLIVGGD